MNPNKIKSNIQRKREKIEQQISNNLHSNETNENLLANERGIEPQEEHKQEYWNRNFDGITTKKKPSNFINYLCELDIDYAFNNRYDGFEKVFGTAVVEAINFYIQCAALFRQHDPILGSKIIDIKLLNFMEASLCKRFENNKKFIDNEVGLANLALTYGNNLLNIMRKQLEKYEIKEHNINNLKLKQRIDKLLKDKKILPSDGFWSANDDLLLGKNVQFYKLFYRSNI